jgi:hypothetical protein
VPSPDLSPIQAVVLRQITFGQNFIIVGIYVRNTWNLTNPGLNADNFDKNNSISLYPNPTNNGIVSFNSDLNGNKNIKIYDISGREVLNTNISENSFNVNGLNSGAYLVKINSENKSYTLKLIIK